MLPQKIIYSNTSARKEFGSKVAPISKPKKGPLRGLIIHMCEEERLLSAANLANGLLRCGENAAFKWHEVETGSLTLGFRA
jgi:hypothetical protein